MVTSKTDFKTKLAVTKNFKKPLKSYQKIFRLRDNSTYSYFHSKCLRAIRSKTINISAKNSGISLYI